ncbi:MAG TPA: hypothetical protein VIK18_20220 [Pirellulales bacterium]
MENPLKKLGVISCRLYVVTGHKRGSRWAGRLFGQCPAAGAKLLEFER